MIRFFIIWLTGMLSLGCADKTLDIEDWRAYIRNPNNGLIQSSQFNQISTQLVYKPSDAMIWQELNYTKTSDKDLIDSLKKKYSPYLYFTLSLSNKGVGLLEAMKGNDSGYYGLLEALSFRMNDHVGMITTCEDTVDVIKTYFFRSFDSGISTDVLLVFGADKVDECESFEVHLKDIGLNLPTQKYPFETSHIRALPRLTLLRD
ncbi:MAG: hypothetical protein KI790_05710 [Cyclobacteriaceae bacterium]|nr:hypothetical protein [Cyclobacteriaceae bacterium HetDA_MAG_MS6]